MAEIKAFFTGQIPDGILFRVSSIDQVTEKAFERHQAFVADLVPLLEAKDLTRLTGLAVA